MEKKKIKYIYIFISFVIFAITVFAVQTAFGGTAGKSKFLLEAGWEKDRGSIYDRDGNEIVYSVESTDEDGKTELVRKYDKTGAAYSNIVGCRAVLKDGSVIKTGLLEYELAEWLVVGNKPNANIGGSYVLTIDSGLQRKVYDELCSFNKSHKTKKAAAVVIDIQTGEILAMADTPGFDPLELFELADTDAYEQYLEEHKDILFEFCTTSTQTPGSTFKLTTAAALCNLGYAAETQNDGEPLYYYKREERGNRVKNSGDAVNGEIGLTKAIEKSSNVYFARMAKQVDEEIGREKLLEQYEKVWKFNQRIELDFCPLVPTLNLNNRQQLYDTAYGQGSIQTSPLHICMMTAAVADGDFCKPFLIKDYIDCDGKVVASKSGKKDVITRKAVSKEAQKYIIPGMQAVAKKCGVADAAVKTGTAQVGTNTGTIWITGFYPVDEPRYALTIGVFEISYDYFGSNLGATANRIFTYLKNRNA